MSKGIAKGTSSSFNDSELKCAIQNILDRKSSLATLEHEAQGRRYRTRSLADLETDSNLSDEKPGVKAVLALTIDVADVRGRVTL